MLSERAMDDRTTSPDLERDKDLESLFLSLVENLPVCVARKDRRGKITFANQAFCQLLGLPRESVIGKTDFDFFLHFFRIWSREKTKMWKSVI